MKQAAVKQWLKQFPLAAAANARWSCHQSKGQYQALTRHYHTPSALTELQEVAALGRRLWQGTLQGVTQPVRRPRILYVGTDPGQDYSGILQALGQLADVTCFEQEPGVYGQRWPHTPAAADAARHHNGERLCEYVRILGVGELDAVVGQMWGLSMHWRALAEVRTMGIPIINIGMDDRHAFLGWKLSDGTHGGTKGLAPYLSLACTAAPECTMWYEAEGTHALFLPEASDPSVFRPEDGPKTHDICFVGANYGIRAKMVQQLEKAGVTVQAYGAGWPKGRIATEEMPRLFARSRIVLGCGTIGYCDDFFALKMRDFDAPMSGSLYITHANPDLDALFRPGAEIVTFHTLAQMVDRVRYYLEQSAEREQIAAAGTRRAQQEHTWKARFETLFRHLELPAVATAK